MIDKSNVNSLISYHYILILTSTTTLDQPLCCININTSTDMHTNGMLKDKETVSPPRFTLSVDI